MKTSHSIEQLEARIAPAFAPVFELSSVNGSNGFKLSGTAEAAFSGQSVSDAGDVNGDGFADVIVGAPQEDAGGIEQAGASYVVFGKGSGFSADLKLSALNGLNGFKLSGVAAGDQSGRSVSGAGDVNGDGFDDVIIGAPRAAPNGIYSGASYVVFGGPGRFPTILNLSSLNGANGFKISGEVARDFSGESVSAAGDINGDGFGDLIIGASPASANGVYRSGASYVLFGKAAGFSANLPLASIDGANGFRINGAGPSDFSGAAVSAAGDVNGDGFDDVIVGAWYAGDYAFRPGVSYVVFGKATGFASNVNLSSLNGANGFKLRGGAPRDQFGVSVSGAGDVNHDGFADLIIGAPHADANGPDAGASYVMFGKSGAFSASLTVASLTGTSGFKLNGFAFNDYSGTSVSTAGDVNGDGFGDLIVGAPRNDQRGSSSGAAYVVFGRGVEINISDAVVEEGNEGRTGLNFTVSLSEAGTVPVRVELFTMDGTAKVGSDYAALAQATLTFAPGETNKTVTINTLGDTLYENDETLSLILGDPRGGVIRKDTGIGTIGNDDAPPVVTIAGASVLEGDSGMSDLVFAVSLSAASGLPATVNFASTDGTALAGGDYTALAPGTVTFAPGETTKTIVVQVLGEMSIEDHETFSVALSAATGATIGTGTATGMILNDDTALRIAGVSAQERNSGVTPFGFTLGLEKPSAIPVTVSYEPVDGTASAGSDYEAIAPTQLTFAAGETSKTITVNVLGDTEVEAHETFSVVLSGASGALIAEGTATGTILNDDTLVRITDAALLEGHAGARAMTFTVSLTAPSARAVSVDFASADGTATAGDDYTALPPGTLEFAPGETTKTLTVEVLGDVRPEASETFSVVLANVTAAVIEDDTGVGTILDDDVTVVGRRKATFTDADGELVTIKVSKGTLKVEDFTIVPSGVGAQLALVDFSEEAEFAGASLSITAKAPRGVVGDGFAHVGFINATAIDLGMVKVKGDLGQIDAGDGLDTKPGLKSLSAQALGRSGLLAQLPGGSAQSDIAGALGALKVKDGMHDAALSVSGDIGAVKITGDVRGSALRSDGKIGAISISGDLSGNVEGIATISARGVLAPASIAKALAIGSVTIGGSVDRAQILAGYDRSGAAVNGDAGIGTVFVGGNWSASSLAAGARAGGDGMFGTDDDAPFSPSGALVARIASITIIGTATGSAAEGDHFGFVAEEIGSLKAGGVKFSFTPGAGNDLAGQPVGASGDLQVREVT